MIAWIYLSLSTQIEEMISYKYWIVICNQGRHYFAIILCFWCSYLECSDSCLNVSYFFECMFIECDWSKRLLHYFWLCDLLILVFSMGLQILFAYLVQEEITILFLHSFLSCMSTLFVALRSDEKWNILRLLNFHWWLH